MINRTLDVYRMEMGEYQPTLEDFDLSALLARVAKQTELAFEERRIKVALPSGETARCLGEPLLCYSLFSNLLKNAAEASPDGAHIAIALAPGYGSVHVCVDNEGEVPDAMREVFFDKYATAGKAGGNGLGTYSVKLMAEVQGGSVAMESSAGHTRITVTLPNTGIA
jgi:two-component system sensor histidine kinase/response regulator